MSKTVKIGSQDQLRAFLRILAEESYSQAKVDVGDERKHQATVARAAKRDIGAFMKEEDDPTSPAAPKPPAPEPPPTDLGVGEEPAGQTAAPPPEAKPAAPAPTEPIEPSFDAVTRAILDLRSGKSVKDSAIETELEAYYDRLNEAERYSMIIFLRSLSDIVTGKQMGGQAPEPSSPPHSISISRPESAAPAAEVPPEPPPSEPEPSVEPPASLEEPPAPSAGPIQVGSPVSEAFRAHIRRLILANR